MPSAVGERGTEDRAWGGTTLSLFVSAPQLRLGSTETCLPKAGVLMWSGELAVTLSGRKTPFISLGRDK